jgi:hypothetical protein
VVRVHLLPFIDIKGGKMNSDNNSYRVQNGCHNCKNLSRDIYGNSQCNLIGGEHPQFVNFSTLDEFYKACEIRNKLRDVNLAGICDLYEHKTDWCCK